MTKPNARPARDPLKRRREYGTIRKSARRSVSVKMVRQGGAGTGSIETGTEPVPETAARSAWERLVTNALRDLMARGIVRQDNKGKITRGKTCD